MNNEVWSTPELERYEWLKAVGFTPTKARAEIDRLERGAIATSGELSTDDAALYKACQRIIQEGEENNMDNVNLSGQPSGTVTIAGSKPVTIFPDAWVDALGKLGTFAKDVSTITAKAVDVGKLSFKIEPRVTIEGAEVKIPAKEVLKKAAPFAIITLAIIVIILVVLFKK